MAKKGDMPDWLDEEDLSDGGDDIFAEEDGNAEKPVLSRGGRSKKAEEKPAKKDRRGGRGKDDDDDEKEDAGGDGEKKQSAIARAALRHAKRPGEQEVFKSPLVLTLGGGFLVLAVLAGSFWFIIGRNSAEKEMIAIDAAISDQRYTQAMTSLDDFLMRYPRGKWADEAVIKRAKVRVDKEIVGSAADWKAGLEALNLMIDDCRDLETFEDLYQDLASYVTVISKGSLNSAKKTAEDGIKRASRVNSGNRELLDISEQAELMIDRFSDPDNPPTETHTEIEALRESTIIAIRKHEGTDGTYVEIAKALEAKKPLQALTSRRRLLDRYPDMSTHKKLNTLLAETLALEKSLVQHEEIRQPASKQDRPSPVPPPLTLALHTRARTNEVSDGRTIFAVAQGTCYGIDTVTGDPKWRRTIGPDSPFFPIQVETTVQGLLVYDTAWQEVVLLQRHTGELVWRAAIEDLVSGNPVVHAGQIYLPTLGNRLYKIELETGEVATRLTFAQPVHAPPVLTRDEQFLVVAGHEAVCYSLNVRDLTCANVAFTSQKPGAIDVPLLAMGELILMIENDQVDSAMMRVFDASAAAEGLPERTTKRLTSQVRDPAVLVGEPMIRGNQLFVPAAGEQFSVFTVSDDPEKEALSPITQPPAISDYDGKVHMLAGPDGRLWTAGDILRQFQLTQNAMPEDQKKQEFLGATAQPIQNIGRTLFVGRHQLESDSVAMTHFDGEEMLSEWKTVVGSGLLAVMPNGETSVMCLTKSGDLFQVSEQELEAGGFRFRADGTLDIPVGLDEPLQAGVLPNRQIAVAKGGEHAHLWIVNQAGKIAKEFPLESPPVAPLVPLAGGAVVPLATKLRLLGTRNGLVEDFLGRIEKEDSLQWAHVMPIDDNHILVVDVEGRVTRVQFRTSPSAHMQALDTIELGQPIDVAPVVSGDRVVIADASGKLQVLNTAGFDRVAECLLDAPAIGRVAVVGETVLVENSKGDLEARQIADGMPVLWSIPLNGDHLSGRPIVQDGVVILATMNGSIHALNAASGESAGSLQLDQPVEHGPFKVGKFLVVASIDGSLYRIESVLGGEQ